MRVKFLEKVIGNKGTPEEYTYAEGEVVDIEDDSDRRSGEGWIRRGKAEQTVDDVEVPDDEPDHGEGGYADMTVRDLQRLVRDRELDPDSRKKSDLISVLERADS